MNIRQLIAALILAALALTSCSQEVRSLGAVGVDSATARCLLAETEGRMDADRLVDIVGERTSYSAAEEDLVVRAFVACVG